MVNIAVLGYGTVGSGVVEVINTNHESINKRAGQEIYFKFVLDLRDFPGDPVQEKIVHDYEIILNDPEIGIVWPELIGAYSGSASPEGYALADGTPQNLREKGAKQGDIVIFSDFEFEFVE